MLPRCRYSLKLFLVKPLLQMTLYVQVVVRSKSHGVTREGKLVQPSIKMERGPLDWGAEMVRAAERIFE